MVYMQKVLLHQMGILQTEDNIAIQLSSGSAYVSGYRTERLSTTYKDVAKPSVFDTGH